MNAPITNGQQFARMDELFRQAREASTVRVPVALILEAMTALERAHGILRDGDTHQDRYNVGGQCWKAAHDLGERLIRLSTDNAASDWARDSMSPEDRIHYFGE